MTSTPQTFTVTDPTALTGFGAVMKELYPDDVLVNMALQQNPWLAMIPKDESWQGYAYIQPVIYAPGAGRSATFSKVVANTSGSKVDRFVVTHVKDYARFAIDNLTIESTMSDRGAFVQAIKLEVDQAINAISNSLGHASFGSGSGSLGCVSAATATTVTLTNAEDSVHFYKGQMIASDTVDGGGTVTDNAAAVTGVDRDSGIITFAAVPSGVAAGDYLFAEGDYDAKMAGLAAWCPLTAPGSTAFFGMDRTSDTHLSGIRIAASTVRGLPIEEKILKAVTRLAREGGRPDLCLLNFENFEKLIVSLDAKKMFLGTSKIEAASAFFDAVTIASPTGPIKVVADRSCQKDRAYVLEQGTWVLASTGKAPHILDRDGKMLRESTSDSYEGRVAFYGNMVCKAPGRNAVVGLSDAA